MANKKFTNSVKNNVIAKNNVEKKVEAAVDEKKTAAVVKPEVKKEEVKSETKNAEVQKTEAKKAEAKLEEPKKDVAPKKTTKTAAKKEITQTVYVQFAGKEVAVDDMMPKIKKVWQKAGNRIKDIKDVKLYVKPEDNKVYFVINDDFSDSVDFE